jgi:hypothetical protein
MGMGELQLDIYAQVRSWINRKQTERFALAYSTRIWCENSNG